MLAIISKALFELLNLCQHPQTPQLPMLHKSHSHILPKP